MSGVSSLNCVHFHNGGVTAAGSIYANIAAWSPQISCSGTCSCCGRHVAKTSRKRQQEREGEMVPFKFNYFYVFQIRERAVSKLKSNFERGGKTMHSFIIQTKKYYAGPLLIGRDKGSKYICEAGLIRRHPHRAATIVDSSCIFSFLSFLS